MNKRSEIIYNMGVQLLFASKPVAAFDCFMEANDIFESHPRFWLRLAESCIMVYQQVILNSIYHLRFFLFVSFVLFRFSFGLIYAMNIFIMSE